MLLNQGCKIVIITLGPLGAIFASEDKPKPQWVQVPIIENPVDTSVSNFLESLKKLIITLIKRDQQKKCKIPLENN